jgi:hypothetical protein
MKYNRKVTVVPGKSLRIATRHLGEKSSEIEIILAVRMEFLFGVIFD